MQAIKLLCKSLPSIQANPRPGHAGLGCQACWTGCCIAKVSGCFQAAPFSERYPFKKPWETNQSVFPASVMQSSKPEVSEKKASTSKWRTTWLVDYIEEGPLVLPSFKCPVFQLSAWWLLHALHSKRSLESKANRFWSLDNFSPKSHREPVFQSLYLMVIMVMFCFKIAAGACLQIVWVHVTPGNISLLF